MEDLTIKPDTKHLTVSEITTAYMMVSELGKKFHAHQSAENVDEESLVAPPASSRPGSGILTETLQEIAEEDTKEHEDEEEGEDEEEEEEGNEIKLSNCSRL